jgi:hypothetical protein
MLNVECLLDEDSALYDDVSIRCCGNGVTMNSLFIRRCGNGVTMNSLFTRRCGNACSNELSVYPLLGSSHKPFISHNIFPPPMQLISSHLSSSRVSVVYGHHQGLSILLKLLHCIERQHFHTYTLQQF